MTRFTLPESARRHAPRTARHRGSLLVLAVVVLVLIALMGLAYIQQAKMDRFATDRFSRDYTELVINGIIADLRTHLRKDYTENWDSPYGLYDYPWTDYSPGSGGPHPHADDRYLAFTFPEVSGSGLGDIVWRHLSNVSDPEAGNGGNWLLLPANDNDPTDTPREALQIPIIDRASTTDAFDSDRFQSLDFLGRAPSGGELTSMGATGTSADWEDYGADADGDGIRDSRWQYVPAGVRNFGDLEFVMAVRMIDLSSLINVNVATPNELDNSGEYVASAGLPRGYFPSDLDVSRLVYRAQVPAGPVGWWNDVDDGLDQLMRYRVFSNAMSDQSSLGTYPGWSWSITSDFADLDAAATSWDSGYGGAGVAANLREAIWFRQGAVYGSTANRYTIDNELELRHRGGLNDSDTTTAFEGGGDNAQLNQPGNAGWEFGMPGITRNIQGSNFAAPDPAEGSYENVMVNVLGGGNAGDAEAKWFAGLDGTAASSSPATDTTTLAGRTFPALRHFLTTVSGHVPYLPNYGGGGGGPGNRLKFDLNEGSTISTYEANIADRLEDALLHNSSVTSVGYHGLNVDQVREIIGGYVANISDYRDNDYQPLRYTYNVAGTDVDFYGLERLPFLREVYLQVAYEERDTENFDENDDDDSVEATVKGLSRRSEGQFNEWIALDGVNRVNISAGNPDPDTRAIVIELGNPFFHELNASDLEHLRVRLSQPGHESIWVVSDGGYDTDASASESRDTLSTPVPGRTGNDTADTLVLVSRPLDELTGAQVDDGDEVTRDMGLPSSFSGVLFDLPPGPDLTGTRTPDHALEFVCDGTPITIELQVLREDGDATNANDWITYDRIADIPGFADRIPTTYSPPGAGTDYDTNQDTAIAMRSVQRQTHGLTPPDDSDVEYLIPAEGTPRQRDPGDGTAATNGAAVNGDGSTVWGLDEDLKPGMPGTSLLQASFQLPRGDRVDNRPFYSLTELGTMPLVPLHRVPTGGSGGLMFGEILEARLTAGEDFAVFLDLDVNPSASSGVAASPPAASGLSYVGMLFDMFTTISPRYTPADEDNYDGDENAAFEATPAEVTREQRIPGTINVNTASLPVLTYAAPLPENTDWTTSLMQAIVDYRDNPTDATYRPAAVTNRRQDVTPGIASLGELLYVNPGSAAEDMQSESSAPTLGVYNLYPKPEDAGVAPDALETVGAHGGSNEARIARLQFLSQTLTTRSDLYAAFVKLRGYKTGAYDDGPQVEAEFIVILDRSTTVRVDNAGAPEDESPRVIGYKRIR